MCLLQECLSNTAGDVKFFFCTIAFNIAQSPTYFYIMSMHAQINGKCKSRKINLSLIRVEGTLLFGKRHSLPRGSMHFLEELVVIFLKKLVVAFRRILLVLMEGSLPRFREEVC